VETLEFSAGASGVKSLEVRIDPVPGEQNLENNKLTRVLLVTSGKHRVLYVEGEPRWSTSFCGAPLMTTQHQCRLYAANYTEQNLQARHWQSRGVSGRISQQAGDLFEYEGIILGSVEEAFFTAGQAQAIKDL